MITDTVRKMVARAGDVAGLGFPVHPHQLRHACGFVLANKGHDTRALKHYLGHKNIAAHRPILRKWHRIDSKTSGRIEHPSIAPHPWR
jgi:integrase